MLINAAQCVGVGGEVTGLSERVMSESCKDFRVSPSVPPITTTNCSICPSLRVVRGRCCSTAIAWVMHPASTVGPTHHSSDNLELIHPTPPARRDTPTRVGQTKVGTECAISDNIAY